MFVDCMTSNPVNSICRPQSHSLFFRKPEVMACLESIIAVLSAIMLVKICWLELPAYLMSTFRNSRR